MMKIINDYLRFFEVAQTNDIVLVSLFFFFAFLASIACFFLPLKYSFWYKKIEATYFMLQVLAFLFFGVFAIKVYFSGNDPNIIFLASLMGVNFIVNWYLYDKIIRAAAYRLQIKKNGPYSVEPFRKVENNSLYD